MRRISMKKQQKSWETPQLIILARGTPAETLTTGCKVIEVGVLGAGGANQAGCADQPTQEGGNCGSCQARSGQS